MKDVAIVNYNTPELTIAAIRSLWKHTPDCRVTVFDNSDTRPFPGMEGVTVLDNTKGQLIDFKAMLDRYPNKRPTTSNWGSEKHIASIELLFSYFPDGFLLLDSDVLVKKDVSCFFDPQYAWIGEVDRHPLYSAHSIRVLPMILWINVPMCNEAGVHFCHEGMVFMMSYTSTPYYDTGGSFYFDCLKAGLPGKEIKKNDYIEHLGHASFTGRNWRGWLEYNKHLYENMEEQKTRKKPGKNPILVVIPYCSAGAQGRELEYAVAGWRRHFKEDYLIVLAGENHPITETGDDICCVESPRVLAKNGYYRQHLDYVSCLKKVRAAFPESKGFIMVADDCYAVNDFDMTDVMLLKQKADDMGGSLVSPNGWQRDKARTRIKLVEGGYPTRNFTTHLPQYYEWDKLAALWEKYDMENVSYVMEDLYYNIYYPNRIPLQLNIDFDNFKCGVYRSNPRLSYIERAFRKQIWITNSPEGWIAPLDRMLAEYYGI